MLRRFVVIAVLMFTAGFADENYRIRPADFVMQEPLLVTPRIPMQPEFGDRVLPSKPDSLETGYLYLRKKNNAQTYSWYKAKPVAQGMAGLNVFRPLTSRPVDFIAVRFYGSRTVKAFQDESEIYFDRHFIYSSRVSTLYYMEDGQWHELKAQSLDLGSLELTSVPPCSVALDGQVVGVTPQQISAVPVGVHPVKFWAPGYLPVVAGVMVVRGQMTRREMKLMVLDTLPRYQVPDPVAAESIQAARRLEELEPLWDRVRLNEAHYRRYLDEQKKLFEAQYPPLLPAPLSVPVGDVGYRSYRDSYLQTRDEAYGLYLSAVLRGAKEHEALWKLVNARKDSLEGQILEERVIVEAFKIEDGALYLKLRDSSGRIDAGWVSREDTSWMTDSVRLALRDFSATTALWVRLENKPARLGDSLRAPRRHYRFLELSLSSAQGLRVLKGRFILPDYLEQIPEVKEWWVALRPAAEIIQRVENAPRDATAVASRPRQPAGSDWVELFRGTVAEIPGGVFRYKGKVVEISPFAIHTTEVTQEHYQRIALKNPARKFVGARLPVHSITWHDARKFCQEIGGDLPTEAQWEFAARAGIQSGYLWKESPGGTISDYAVFGRKPSEGPLPVATRKPNAYGLYDMSGNVAEWTRDKDSWFHFYVNSKDPQGAWMGADRVFKGGSWISAEEEELDLKSKDYEDPRYWGPKLGFRCVFPARQILLPDSVKTILLQKDSLAKSMGIIPLGQTIRQLVGDTKPENRTQVSPVGK